jgi:mannose-6-phosphate isomerase
MIYRLINTIQEYAWGDKTSLSQLLGVSNLENKPQAELWLGAHPKSPSIVLNGSEKIPLDKLIARSPHSTLGEKVKNKFGKLPFLLKILAAGEPLSIQAHPNLEQAKNGFARENLEKIPLDAFQRSYKDDNHKPEIICALTLFHAMNGFRPIPQIVSNLEKIPDPFFQNLVSVLKKNEATIGLKQFFEEVMRCPEKLKENLLQQACLVAQKNKDIAFEWVLTLNKQYPGDIGALCPLFLNVITLHPGEAMFLEAGRLHSYLKGVGVELMANSDNVLRGGLTPKFVDIDELLKILKFEVSNLQILKPQGFLEEKYFQDFVEEFSLSVIESPGDRTYEIEQNKKPSILICISGSGRFFDEENDIHFEKGQSFFIPASQATFKISGSGFFYRATVATI